LSAPRVSAFFEEEIRRVAVDAKKEAKNTRVRHAPEQPTNRE
jgi:hypothetical protein